MAADLLKDLEPEVDSITITPSDGGRFEITVNEKLIYSKLQTGRHAEAGEVVGLLKKLIKT